MSLTVSLDLVQQVLAQQEEFHRCRAGISSSDAASLERAQSDRVQAKHRQQKQLEDKREEEEEKKKKIHKAAHDATDDGEGEDEFRMGGEEIYQEDGEFVFRSVNSAGSSSSSAAAAAAAADINNDPSLPAATAKATRLLQSQFNLLTTLQSQFTASTATSLAAYFDTLYLPLFSVLLSHPRAAEKAANPAVPQSTAGLSLALLPGQDRVWELALRCLLRLLDASSKEPAVVRAVLVKRFFGIFQLLMHFLPVESKATDSTSQQSSKPQQSSSRQKSLTVYHSEETRLAAYECVQSLFLCVEEQLAAVSKSSTMPQELQNLLSMFQSNPAFSLSLGYYLHLLLQCVGSEKNRSIRSCCVGGLDQIRRVLSHAKMNVIIKPHSSQPTSPFDSVIGDALLLSYFPGMATALFNVLAYDSSKVKSGGWKLQMAAFRLFVDLVRHVVRYVASDDKIVQAMVNEKSETDHKASMMEDVTDSASDFQSLQSTDAAMAKLYALLPAPASSSDSQSWTTSRPALQLSKLHPVLQSIMKPLDADWWRETRGNLSNLMQKIFAATQLTQRPEMAQMMLQAALEFLVGTKEDDSRFPNLTRYENSIYTTLMPSPSVLHWLEFVIYCTQHQDATIQTRANEAVAQIAAKTEKRSKQVTAVTAIPNEPSLVPLLTSSLSSHLIKLPRLLYTASESAQLTHLKTVHGYILLLGKQRVLFNFMESDLDHVLKILYRSFEVEATESKVLEREANSNQNSDTRLINSSTSTAVAIPTYYSFSISHLHSSAAQELPLSILRSLGFYLSTHFGLFIAHLHEQLIRGIQQVESGNYSDTNQLKETVLFINQIILGVGTALRSPEFEHLLSISEIIPHIELLLFEYLNPTLWHLPLSAKQNRNLSNADLQNNLLVVSLLVRGIGDMATALGEGFSSSLMHILYPLFEKLGSRHSIVHHAALVTLYRVAIACGYGEGMDTASLSSAEPVLQAMIVANMDYLVEQMSVELRDLDFSAPQMAVDNVTASHPMTLPLVLSALLTKISLSCAQAIIPLLDDVLQRILDKLCQVSWNAPDEQEEYVPEDDPSILFEDPSADHILSSHMSRLAYLEILRSIVAAIHRIQLSTKQLADSAPVSSLFASASALPLLQTPSQPLLKEEPKVDEYAEVDSMLNLMDDEPAEVPAVSKQGSAPLLVAVSANQDASSAPTSGIRARLQSLIATRLESSVQAKKEEDWLKHTRAGGDSSSFSIEEESDAMEDVPRDSEGKTRAEQWYEEREKVRAREEQKKFNSVNGIEDPEADEDLEREEKAHKDEPEIPLTKDQATALSIFQQCRNFLLPGTGPRALALQHATLCIAAEAIPVLERVPKSYFPEIAKFWPSLLQSLRLFDNATTVKVPQRVHESLRGAGFENSAVSSSLTNVTVDDTTDRHLSQLLSSLTTNATAVATTGADSFTHSTASPLFIQSLQVLALICRTASKFMAGRFATELWPLLQQILHQEKTWMKEIRMFQLSHKKESDDKHLTETDARLKLLPAYKIQKAVLDTLAGLARLPDLSSHHLLSLAQHAAPYLSSHQPLEFQERAILILQSLMQLDRDMVWFVLWKLNPELAHKPINAVPIQSSTFLSHPCFLQTFQNFNAHLLLNNRGTSQTIASESNDPYEQNVRTLLDNLNSPALPKPKLSLF